MVESISEYKGEPQWMRDFRLKALAHFQLVRRRAGAVTSARSTSKTSITSSRASEKNSRDWSEVPEDIKNTFDRLGIPEAERKFLAGVGAQYESEVVYHQVNEKLEAQGVIFTDMDTALREHEDLLREYWATVIPPNDNKLAALNSAVWSGGSFVYVPAGVRVEMPLQAYFRINTENMGQFERTLIIAEEGADVHYIEGCTAPVYSTTQKHCCAPDAIIAQYVSRIPIGRDLGAATRHGGSFARDRPRVERPCGEQGIRPRSALPWRRFSLRAASLLELRAVPQRRAGRSRAAPLLGEVGT